MAKIERIRLQSLEIVEIDGEFKEVLGEEKIIPCMLTNYAMAQAQRTGLISTSLISDFISTIDIKGAGQDVDTEKLMNTIDQEKCLKAIYIGCMGANKNLEISYDEFLQLYNGSYVENVKIYTSLISELMDKENNFAGELKKNTAKGNGKGKK